MIRYIKEAFWARPRLAGLGAIPWNVVGLVGASILGFAEPSVWLAALGLETLYLYALASNGRFQHWVDARHQPPPLPEAAARTALLASLDRPARERLQVQDEKVAKIERLYRDASAEDYVFELNREALKKLTWLYLKLLIAERNIRELGQRDPAEIRRQIESIRAELASPKGSQSLKDSKQATLGLLEQRLASLERRDDTLAEIYSDLTRIEAQLDLALDQASLEGRPATISANIDLVSHLLDDNFGEASAAIASLDQTYGARADTAVRQ